MLPSIARIVRTRLRASLLTLTILTGIVLAACSASTSDNQHLAGKPVRAYGVADVAATTPMMPSFVTADVRDGYEYALAHPEQLQYMPCYCGCGLNAAHKSNADCYIGGVDSQGKVAFDNHASFCSVCLEITRDVKRLSAEGKSLRDIRAFVDREHGEKGPGTDTPLPPL